MFPSVLRHPAKMFFPPPGGRVLSLEKRAAIRRSADEEGPSPAFLAACDRQQIPAGERRALWRLHRVWGKAGLDEGDRLRILFEDHEHWRLFALSREGDAEAATEFDRFWRGYVRAFLSGRFRPDQAEEIAAAFFARLYRLVKQEFDWHCPFSVYLRAIVVNVARDEARRLAMSRERHVGLDQEEGPHARHFASPEPSPEEQTLAAERGERFERALAELKPLDRHILRACLVDGESGQDLARELGMSRDALYQRLHRAKAKLKQTLERDGLVSDSRRRKV